MTANFLNSYEHLIQSKLTTPDGCLIEPLLCCYVGSYAHQTVYKPGGGEISGLLHHSIDRQTQGAFCHQRRR